MYPGFRPVKQPVKFAHRAQAQDEQALVPLGAHAVARVEDPMRRPFLLVYNSSCTIILPPPTYQAAVEVAYGLFPDLRSHQLKFSTTDLPFLGDGELAHITPAAWSGVINRISSLGVNRTSAPIRYAPVSDDEGDTILVTVNGYDQRRNFRLPREGHIRDLRQAVADWLGSDPHEIRLLYEGIQLIDDATLSDSSIHHGNVVDFMCALKGGKPAIYLFPRHGEEVHADVSLTLSEVWVWSISAVYPVAPVKECEQVAGCGGNQEVAWSVIAKPDGTLHDKRTGSDVAYLFWEAETNARIPTIDSPPASPRPELTFDPRTCALTPSNSILLPIDAVPKYLDAALTALELHVEARTSFITYWLPSLLKHKHIALRFVPQKEYECAARLDVSPTPDVVVRCFMVFQGVELGGGNDNSTAFAEWDAAAARAKEDPSLWRAVVGMPDEKGVMVDESLFRVLEWGGMEVKA